MKLNKLLYFAQGHYLQQYNEPLFDDKILAWQFGPVVESVYLRYKKNADRPITEYDIDKARNISEDVRDFLLNIAGMYGKYTAYTLKNMTHIPGSPWSQVMYNAEMPVNMIHKYFTDNLPSVSHCEIRISDDDLISKRDSKGRLVLPKEWNDEKV